MSNTSVTTSKSPRPWILSAGVTLLAALALSVPVNAAVVYQTGVITDETSVFNNGNVLSAWGADATVNGINFASSDPNLTFSGWSTCSGDFSNQFSGGLDTLLSGCLYQPGAAAPTVTVNNLVAGENYSLQFLFSNTLNETGYNSGLTIQGEISYNNYYWDSARWLTAEIIASGTSETISFGFGHSFHHYRFLLSGLTVSGESLPVHAPAGFGIMILAMAWLIRTRAKQKAAARSAA